MQSKLQKIIEINGPVVKVDGMGESFIGEIVYVGKRRLLGEVIRLREDIATIQVYEDTEGLKIYEDVEPQGVALSIELGPGLIGGVFDGLGRPLKRLSEHSLFIEQGRRVRTLEASKKWEFTPAVEKGEFVKGLDILGYVKETASFEHRVLCPYDIEGEVVFIASQGEYGVDEVIAKVRCNHKEVEVKLAHRWPVRKKRPVAEYLKPNRPLITGQRVLDFFFPLAKGGSAIIPGGFGAGKTVLQHQLAKWSDTDVIVYIGCGERGNEMTQVLKEFPSLIDPRRKRLLMERTVLIANTSNMPVTAREASIYTGITIAEYFRDMGYDVALMADSTSRWAEALREISGRLEELPAEEGFPAYLPSMLAGFYERAGRCRITHNREGSVSIIGAVSPPGGDFSEPVTVYSQRFVSVFWALDKELSAKRHFPAVSWLQSYSEFLDEVQEWWNSQSTKLRWDVLKKEAMVVLQEDENLQKVVRLIGEEPLPDTQKLILFCARLIKEGFLQQFAFEKNDAFCPSTKQLLLMDTILYFYKKAKGLLTQRIPVSKITELSVCEDIFRAKTEIPNNELERFEDLKRRIDKQLDYIKKEYE
ncbi:MAG: V-type ATP synthase subunit A [Candidatus Omnitrophica bacterium 4484_70.1]|nr:MAG: V-type ATP synthase subunit A [Candidatus Omnitrophica bacterium 4484_70.1]